MRPVAALLASLALLPGAAARAETLRLDLAALQPLPPLAEIVLRGENRGDRPHRVLLRVDDAPAPAYAERANVERLVPPGPFTLRLRAALLATPRGRPLAPAGLRRAIADAGPAPLRLAVLAIEAPPALPDGARGWSFAPEGAAPLAGMEAVGPADPRLGGRPRAVRRPGEDPVLARGLAGVTRFAAPLPPGRWRLALWTEDPGEWETLPAVLERRIRANGRDILLERRTPEAWVTGRYLAGRDAPEPGPADTPWASLGARRGGRVEAVVEVGDSGLLLELAGHPQAATHMAALVAEPAEAPPRAAPAVEAVRAARFAEAWPVLAQPPALPPPAALELRLDSAPEAVAPGGTAVLRFAARAPSAAPATASLAWAEGEALPATLLRGQWRWRRPAPETPGLVLSAAQLRADMAGLALRPDLPRPILAVLRIPEDAPPGLRRLRLHLATADGAAAAAEAAIEVLPLRRPGPAARIGVFLDLAPHLSAFAETRAAAWRQAACDLDTLRGLGLTAIAPPFSPPEEAALPRFAAELAAATARFPGAPPIAYTPLRDLARRHGPAAAAEAAARVGAEARRLGLPAPAWVVADEPHGAGRGPAALALVAAMRAADPAALLAGFLNHPADRALALRLDIALVNHRFGADAADLAALRAAGVAPWLYNLPRLRLGGGLHLWRSGAAGLLQWHARMPTADPFDPTDGREGDVQFLWPTHEVCGAPDLDAELLDLAEAAEDLRWLAWLEAAAAAAPEAAALLARLRHAVPPRWQDAAALPEGMPDAMRNAAAALARRLTVSGPSAHRPALPGSALPGEIGPRRDRDGPAP